VFHNQQISYIDGVKHKNLIKSDLFVIIKMFSILIQTENEQESFTSQKWWMNFHRLNCRWASCLGGCKFLSEKNLWQKTTFFEAKKKIKKCPKEAKRKLEKER
jgi:hypothetical protein